MTKRSAFCFVWQSEGTEYLNHEAGQRKAKATVLSCGKIRRAIRSRFLASIDTPFLPAGQGAAAGQQKTAHT
ncbi:hypothetical protein [Alkalihalophilus marmarensis]|uniref:hypothetical protein n=1 Tax=Alkalihalophilus marmarensis TaxID=521377 RepID=UPI002DB9520A|nr:hypothetical protein [Alkalihalophilus marmarensis]MEC2072112.1 hypothetical protein [Alkalihalophilus marmarensis]